MATIKILINGRVHLIKKWIIMKWIVKVRPHDNSVVWIKKAEENELFHREQMLEIDDSMDFAKFLLGKCKGKEPNLYFVDGKLEARAKQPDALKIKMLKPQIREAKTSLWWQYIFQEVSETGRPFEDINNLRIEREQKHGELLTEIGLLRESEEKKFKKANSKAAKARLSQSNYIYNNVIVSTAKDEAPYLIEWITHHLDLGIEHIFIRDDGSEIPIKETLSTLAPKYLEKITINEERTPHPYSPQRVWYGNWLREWEGKVKWVCFLDIDEFITLNEGVQLNELLNSFKEDVGEVNFGWVEYNAGGQLTKEDKPVKERFKTIAPATPYKRGWYLGKYFVRPEIVERIRIHECELSSGFRRVMPNGEEVEVLNVHAFKNKGYQDPFEQPAHIKHYFTKSKEEWFEKINRGACDAYLRRANDFYTYNPDMRIIEEVQKLN